MQPAININAMLKSTLTLKHQGQVQLHFYRCCYYEQFPGVEIFSVKVTVCKLVTIIRCPLLISHVHWSFKNSQTWSLSWTNLAQPTISQPIFLNCNINTIFPFNLDLLTYCFPSYPGINLYSILVSSMSAKCPAHHIRRDLNTVTQIHTLWSSSS
jgi:hypothetical protein